MNGTADPVELRRLREQVNEAQQRLAEETGAKARLAAAHERLSHELTASHTATGDLEKQIHRLQAELQTEAEAHAVTRAQAASSEASSGDLEKQIRRLQAELLAEADAHVATRAQAADDAERHARISERQSTGTQLEQELSAERSRASTLQSRALELEESARLAALEVSSSKEEAEAAQQSVVQLTEELNALRRTHADDIQREKETSQAAIDRLELALRHAQAAALADSDSRSQALGAQLEETQARFATEMGRRDADQSRLRTLTAEVTRLRESGAEAAAAGAAKVNRLQERFDDLADRRSAEVRELTAKLTAEQRSRAEAQSKAKLDLLAAEAAWEGRMADLLRTHEER